MTRPRVGVDRLRKLAQSAVERSSLRAVADEIGMSFNGLWNFLAGANPHQATIEKLLAWQQAKGHVVPGPSRADMMNAVEILAAYVAGSPTQAGRDGRLQAIARGIQRNLPSLPPVFLDKRAGFQD